METEVKQRRENSFTWKLNETREVSGKASPSDMRSWAAIWSALEGIECTSFYLHFVICDHMLLILKYFIAVKFVCSATPNFKIFTQNLQILVWALLTSNLSMLIIISPHVLLLLQYVTLVHNSISTSASRNSLSLFIVSVLKLAAATSFPTLRIVSRFRAYPKVLSWKSFRTASA